MSTLLAETSAGPLGPLILIFCLGVGAFAFIRALRARGDSQRVTRGPLYGGSLTARAVGTAADIADGGQVPAQELLGALAVKAASPVDEEDEDEGTGKLLGLAYHRWRHRTSDLWDPGVYDGTRNGRQVFIRLNRNAAVRGPGLNMRRMRSVCAVRAAVVEFELVAEDGRLTAVGELPGSVAVVLEPIAASPDVWHDLRVLGGQDGLVASRGIAQDRLGGWIYDLWLLERLATCLGGTALAAEPLGREWTPPYDMGDWAPAASRAYA
ncbi:MAG: hypothetical protein QOG68_1517 [Solirubrobacteraceae bacterium]|nr:hypothetical protein [Solirubrobacteraceae bacterium]